DWVHVIVRLWQVHRGTIRNQSHEVLRDAGAHLTLKFLSARKAGTGYCLERGDDQALEAGGLGQRLEDRHGSHGGAVWVGNDATLCINNCVRVYLGHNQWDVCVKAEVR